MYYIIAAEITTFSLGAYGGRWIEDNLRTVNTKHHPVLRVMTAITDVNGDTTELCLENGVSGVALHVVGRLVKVVHTRNMILAMFAQVVTGVGYDNSSVPENITMFFITLENRRNNHHVVLARQLLDQLGRWTILCVLSELTPWELLSSTETIRHCYNIKMLESCEAFRFVIFTP